MAWNNARKGNVTKDLLTGVHAERKRQRKKERSAKTKRKVTQHDVGYKAMPETVELTMPVRVEVEVVVFGGKVRIVGLSSSSVSLAAVVSSMKKADWDKLCRKYGVTDHEKPLTRAEAKAVRTLLAMLGEDKYEGPMPTIRAVMDRLGLSSPGSVHKLLKSIEDKGYIQVKDKNGVRWLDVVLDPKF